MLENRNPNEDISSTSENLAVGRLAYKDGSNPRWIGQFSHKSEIKSPRKCYNTVQSFNNTPETHNQINNNNQRQLFKNHEESSVYSES